MYLSVIVSIIVGIVVGVVFSVVFGVYNQKTTDTKLYKFFGIRSDALVSDGLLFGITGGLIAIAGMSVIVRDTEYITEYPFRFLVELLYISIIPSLIVFIMTYLRFGEISPHTWIEFTVVTIKFMAFHILMQLCGFYRSVFGI